MTATPMQQERTGASRRRTMVDNGHGTFTARAHGALLIDEWTRFGDRIETLVGPRRAPGQNWLAVVARWCAVRHQTDSGNQSELRQEALQQRSGGMAEIDVTSVPNAARVYDYFLGGTHNHEVDRQAAEYMSALVPSTRRWVRKLRRFLHVATAELREENFVRFLDLASGLPTEDHIHSTVPAAQVVYVDNDPLVFASGSELLGDNPRTRYLQADIRDIEAILRSAPVVELLDGGQKVGIGFNAITCFLADDEIRRIVHALYDWAPPGSKIFGTFETKAAGAMTPKMQQFVDMFERLGSPYHFLTPERSRALMHPWVEDERGLLPLSEWLSLDEPVAAEDREGVGLEFYGAILVKPTSA